jgi:hypothetical protein
MLFRLETTNSDPEHWDDNTIPRFGGPEWWLLLAVLSRFLSALFAIDSVLIKSSGTGQL